MSHNFKCISWVWNHIAFQAHVTITDCLPIAFSNKLIVLNTDSDVFRYKAKNFSSWAVSKVNVITYKWIYSVLSLSTKPKDMLCWNMFSLIVHLRSIWPIVFIKPTSKYLNMLVITQTNVWLMWLRNKFYANSLLGAFSFKLDQIDIAAIWNWSCWMRP